MKKIMFNDQYGLTDAVLQGRKTMTRRMVSVPEYWHGIWVWGFAFDKQSHSLLLCDADEGLIEDPDTGECAYILPKYKIGEVVAVAQSYKDLGYTKEWVEQHISPNPNAKPTDPFEKKYPGWSNKMFVPAELNKAHQIRITDIKVERLQDISDDDCLREGVVRVDNQPKYMHVRGYAFTFKGWWQQQGRFTNQSDTPRGAFAALIDKVSGKGTWSSNPWVLAYSFKLIK